MLTLFFYLLAALGEIGGCFTFWMWWRLGRSVWWLMSGMAALTLFARALAQVESGPAGRAFTAHGGVYITASLGWLRLVKGVEPVRWDVLRAVLCLLGTANILFGPHSSAEGLVEELHL